MFLTFLFYVLSSHESRYKNRISGMDNTVSIFINLHEMFGLYFMERYIHLLFNAFGEHGKYKPRFCVHIAKFVMCRQPHQKSGCKQPRTSSYTTPSTECFAGDTLSRVLISSYQPFNAIKPFCPFSCSNLSLSLEGTLIEP